jgi:hypothetical protein
MPSTRAAGFIDLDASSMTESSSTLHARSASDRLALVADIG